MATGTKLKIHAGKRPGCGMRGGTSPGAALIAIKPGFNMGARRFENQLNRFFTSGLDRTTNPQMPIGIPMTKQQETQGIMAIMLAVMHKP